MIGKYDFELFSEVIIRTVRKRSRRLSENALLPKIFGIPKK